MTDDIVERLREGVSGPHKNGRPLTVRYSTKAETLLEAADEIERLTAALTAIKVEVEGVGGFKVGARAGRMGKIARKALGEKT